MRTHIPARLLMLTAAGVAFVGVGLGGATGQAADPFVAGQRSTRSVTIGATDAGRAVEHAAALSRALGLPAGAGTVRRLTTASSTGPTTRSSPAIERGARSRSPGSGPTIAW